MIIAIEYLLFKGLSTELDFIVVVVISMLKSCLINPCVKELPNQKLRKRVSFSGKDFTDLVTKESKERSETDKSGSESKLMPGLDTPLFPTEAPGVRTGRPTTKYQGGAR